MRKLALSVAALVLGATAATTAATTLSAQASAPQTTVLRAARMLDPKSGNVSTNAVVVIRGDTIVSVGSNVATPAGAKVIDLGNMILLPV